MCEMERWENQKIECDVVIVDTGYDITHPKLERKNIKGIQIIRGNNGRYDVEELADNNDEVGHGTAISNIIFTHAPYISIFMIKIFDQLLNVDEDLLYFALSYIFLYIKCKIINLSLGIPALNDFKRMYDLCDKIDKKNIAIISAFDNDGSISFPAAFSNVIGVTSNDFCQRSDEYFVINNEIVNIGAKGNAQRIAWLNKMYKVGQGNSYACAHITGICINFLSGLNTGGRRFLLEKLEENARLIGKICNYTNTNLELNYNTSYKNVALFPFNKEMHSLIRFQSLLPFRIVDVYDIRYSFNIGASTDFLLNVKTDNPFIIKKIDDIEWNSIDTIIIGHTHVLMNSIIQDNSLLKNILSEAQKRGKNVYSFDKIPEGFQENKRFVSPNMHKNYMPIPYGKLYRQPKPVLAVFGTSSKQGKFTLQLTIREKLIKRGYSVGQLGTEPSSILFGMDDCFHFGYASEIEVSRFSAISYLNNALYTISQKNIDIIITGCQSGTVLKEEGNLFNYPLPQIEFLFGVLPDAIVLTINAFDDIYFIKRTVLFLESCVECKVIAIVVFPIQYDDNMFVAKSYIKDEEFEKLSADIYQMCRLPTFLLGREIDMDKLIILIEDFFSK